MYMLCNADCKMCNLNRAFARTIPERRHHAGVAGVKRTLDGLPSPALQ
jgi:hypothetical protein